ncbi:nucleotidyl transferase AbiEii/AbiGii toxin family protein [Reichenbachiella sp. MALMAid0571]|uniref:nucleotidyl transferase AbiEii/AbiGii toxin family protein n=1 Tax=Reichenbachiella sp. MALMAid0571 TaxID=3143939 RepID=UPI0032E05707
MHTEILSTRQQELLPSINQFKRSFYLVEGTAIGLQLGHRRSIDFDLFSHTKLNKTRIKQWLSEIPYTKSTLFEDFDQMHFNINKVKVTFFQYPFPVEHPVKWENNLTMPDLLTLAAMKAYALGRKSKWKDYVDLYFLIGHYAITDISRKAKSIFGELFSEKMFLQQLAFHKDIDYQEAVEYLAPNPPTEQGCCI